MKQEEENSLKIAKSGRKSLHIDHNFIILCIAATATGKCNAPIDYLSSTSGYLNKITYFNFLFDFGQAPDRPDRAWYNCLQQKSNEIDFVHDIDEVPALNEFENENKNKPNW